MKITIRRAKLRYLVQQIIKKREEAAVTIQKNYKRFLIQHLFKKVLEFERNFISIKWHEHSEQIPRSV